MNFMPDILSEVKNRKPCFFYSLKQRRRT